MIETILGNFIGNLLAGIFLLGVLYYFYKKFFKTSIEYDLPGDINDE